TCLPMPSCQPATMPPCISPIAQSTVLSVVMMSSPTPSHGNGNIRAYVSTIRRIRIRRDITPTHHAQDSREELSLSRFAAGPHAGAARGAPGAPPRAAADRPCPEPCQALSQRHRPKPPLKGGRPRSGEGHLLCPPSCRVRLLPWQPMIELR